ncbi:type II secretion system F family protein [Haliovirga abyssi]|uniref:Type II secretion system protein F n=1 Tax=Haliovirga abyssi TaxID=2996794 RepID=A0AAU9D6R1_9FUSO|nr:type II secretion system F family protein [Haliovirga abyssi]BDU51701.1 type II secretion system protein F [Haliovirga abyssi]
MSLYKYKGYNKKGEKVEGTVESTNEQQALNDLNRKEITIYEIKEEIATIFSKRASLKDIYIFTKNMNTLLKSGMNLGESLETATNLTKNKYARKVYDAIYEKVRKGESFSIALSSYPGYFDQRYISMIKAGEEGGFIKAVFEELKKTIYEKMNFRKFIISTLTYPVILIFVGIISVAVMFGYVLPRFKQIYDNYGQKLPKITSVIIDLVNLFEKNIISIFAVSMIFIVLSYIFFNSEFLKRKVYKYLLIIPFVNKSYRKFFLYNFSSMMSGLLNSKVSLIKSLEISKTLTKNQYLKNEVEKIITKVVNGNKLSESLNGNFLYDNLFFQLLKVGENSGDLGLSFADLSDTLNDELKSNIAIFSKVFEPLVIIIIGIIFGVLIYAMLIPIINLAGIEKL